MTVSERFLGSVRGEKTDLIPFATFNTFLHHIYDLDSLLQRGMGVVCIQPSVKIWMDGVDVRTVEYTEDGRRMLRTTYRTPVGEVYSVKDMTEATLYGEWIREFMFKTPDDYKVLRYMFSHQRYQENYDEFAKLQAKLGESYIVRDALPDEPLQQLMTVDIMDCMTFSLEWYDNRDEILALYNANVRFQEEVFEVFAKSPAKIADYGGNVVPKIIGPEVFRDYYVPLYDMAADIHHRYGKYLSCHMDDDNTIIMDQIAGCKLDYIESYDPSISLPLSVAKKILKDKALWINWPTGEHYRPLNDVPQITKALVEEYGEGGGLLMGVTENLPGTGWDSFMHAIMDGLGYPK